MSALSWWDIAGMAVLILAALAAGLVILRADDRDYWAGVDWQLRGCRGQAEAVGDAPDFEQHADMAMALLTPDDPALPEDRHLHAVTDKEN